MSLHTLAQHLQSAGRGDDTVLVHMTPREVSGLQSLAMAHGGSLTINPQTGLPEAGFLSALLPIVAGAFLGPAGLQLSALQSGLLVGAAGTAMTGSLGKGLMMGLGAYGGAGLGEGLFGAAAGPVSQAGLGSAQTIAAQNAANLNATAASQIGQTYGAGTSLGTSTVPAFAQPVTTLPGVTAGVVNPGGVMGAAPSAVTTPVALPTQPAPSVSAAAEAAAAKTPSLMDRFQQVGGKLLSGGTEGEEARKKFLEQYKYPMLAAGVAGVSLSQEPYRPPPQEPVGEIRKPRYYSGTYAAGDIPGLSGERSHRFMADGGLANLPVEQMSQQASVGQNTNYPMANIRPYGYAVPRNVPISENVFKPMDYQRTDPYTGEQKFAAGGVASLATGGIKSDVFAQPKPTYTTPEGFISEIKPVVEPKFVAPKLANTIAVDKTIAGLQKFKDLSYDELNTQYKDLDAQLKAALKAKDNAQVKSLQTQMTAIQPNLQGAKQLQDALAARDKTLAANEAATAKAQQDFEKAQAQYGQYQEALSAEKKAWQEQTGRTATGLQYVRAQKLPSATEIQKAINDLEKQKIANLPKPTAVVPAGSGLLSVVTQALQQLNATVPTANQTTRMQLDAQIDALKDLLPQAGSVKPFTSATGPTQLGVGDKKLMEENDIIAVFQDAAGRRPTQNEVNEFLGKVTDYATVASYAARRPDVQATRKFTDADLQENWKYYTGRDATKGELANLRNANATNFNQLRTYIQQQPAYVENLNKMAMAQYQTLAPEQISTIYRDILGKQPTLEEMDQYSKGYTTQGLVDLLKGSEAYKKKFVQGLVPSPEIQQPQQPKQPAAPIQYLPVTKYEPGTVLEYRPPGQAQAGLGAITGGAAPTSSGLQAPLTRGAVTLQGAFPLNPTFQEQLGLQTLASQAAEVAPPLQRGLRFEAPQAQDVFGFQQYGAAPKSVDEAIAAIIAARQQQKPMAEGGYAGGGYHLGDYSDGGRLLKGPGDGVSDSIPASIGNRQPARLADGEFVVPARIVSEIGNGSTDAGARKLYAMMDRVQRARRKSIGQGRVAVDSKADKLLPV